MNWGTPRRNKLCFWKHSSREADHLAGPILRARLQALAPSAGQVSGDEWTAPRMLGTELCPSQNSRAEVLTPVPQNMILFVDGAFKEVIKVK